ncbi:MAG: HAD family hydrolase [Leptolyngbyaceae cyanobacterium CRU_2_3]|nr:HAD family hydrolase [Leptolyngbyaceae cyanobacterium CRU_2_3]
MALIRCNASIFPNVQAILFDKDGTLANSESFLRNLAQRRSRLIDAQVPGVQEPLLMAFGVEGDRINPAGLVAVGTRQENEIAAAAYVAETGRDWVDSLRLVYSAFADAERSVPNKAEHTPPIAGVIELLKTLAVAGLQVGVLSSDSTHQVEAFLQTYQLTPYIQAQFGIDGYSSKFAPALLQQVVSALETEPNQILVVGDSQVDIEVSQKLGALGCIGFTGGWSTVVQLPGADATIHHFKEMQIQEDITF